MRLSILDYSPIFEERTANDALQHSIELAQYAESLGFHRYWLSEHHKVNSVASSAPEILATMILENTSKIRVGAGGIMLPHYSAYKVAETFKMLEARYPNRTDLALGHSKSYQNVFEALNEGKTEMVDFDQQLIDLYKYFTEDTTQTHRFKTLKAMPHTSSMPQIAILGSSLESAERAGRLGAIFVFAPFGQLTSSKKEVIQQYRTTFQHYHPERKAYVIVSTFVLTHENESIRNQLEDSLHYWLQRIHYLKQPSTLYAPDSLATKDWSTREQTKRQHNAQRVVSGTPTAVREQLHHLQHFFEADELLVLPQLYGEENRKNCLKQLAPLI
ncbi:MsnO8 family LLM class oxidoreductase [Staphylococcus sp. 11261D007BR]